MAPDAPLPELDSITAGLADLAAVELCYDCQCPQRSAGHGPARLPGADRDHRLQKLHGDRKRDLDVAEYDPVGCWLFAPPGATVWHTRVELGLPDQSPVTADWRSLHQAPGLAGDADLERGRVLVGVAGAAHTG